MSIIEKFIPKTNKRYSITEDGIVFSNYRYNKIGKKVFKRREIKRFLNLPSRWVTIYRSYPQFVVHEKGCYFPRFD